jgi:hypothetical protein
VPEERRRNADKRSIGKLDFAPFDHVDGLLVHDDFMVTGLDEPACDVLELLACLDEEVVALRDLDCDALSRVAGPDVEARVA